MTTSPMLIVDSTTVRPVRCFPPHTLAVTSCAWNPRNPDVFVTSSLDSTLCMWDVKKPYQPICSLKKYSSNFIPRSVFWAGPLYPGFFNTCERLAMSTKCPVYFHGPGTTSAVLCQNDAACTWDVTFNPFYEALVTCNVVGTVMVTLTPLSRMFTTTGKSKGKHMRKKCHSAILYQVKIVKTHIPSPSPVATANSSQDNKAAAEGSASTPSTKETSRRKRKHSQSSSIPSATNDSHNNVNNSCKESLDSFSNIQLNCDVDCIDSVAATGQKSMSQLQQVTGYSMENSIQGNRMCKSKVNEAVECEGLTPIQSDFTTTNGDLTNGSGDFTKKVGKHHKEIRATGTKKKTTDKDRICDRTTSNSGDDTVVLNSSVDPQKASECDGNIQTLSESPQNVSSPVTSSSNSVNGNSRSRQESKSHDSKSSSTCISQGNETTSSVSPSKLTQGINKNIISVKNTLETNTTTSEIHPIVSYDSSISQMAASASEEETEQSLRRAQSSVGHQDHSQSTSIETRSPSAKTTTVDVTLAGAEGDSVVEPGTVESLYFQDCKLISKELILGYPPEQNKILEDFGGSNLNAVYRVRFNPNPDSSLWLASGGQSGLLRLDNLCGLVQPHRPQVLDFYKKRSKAKS